MNFFEEQERRMNILFWVTISCLILIFVTAVTCIFINNNELTDACKSFNGEYVSNNIGDACIVDGVLYQLVRPQDLWGRGSYKLAKIGVSP